MEYTAKKHRKISAAILLILGLSVCYPAAMAAALPETLVPVGSAVGIDIKCNGVMIVAINEVDTPEGAMTPAIDAGLQPGDVITQVNAEEIKSMAEFKEIIDKTAPETVTVRLVREGQEIQRSLTPAENSNGGYELGLWLKDGMAGIGTITFYDPESGTFGALGHSVSDLETGVIMPLGAGSIMSAHVKSIIPGEAGMPGQLEGEFDFDDEIGTISANTQAGIYGELEDTSIVEGMEAIPVAGEDEIKLGAATVLTNISGVEITECEVEISRIFSGGDMRNMMITVTDPTLLEKTGGIVQGMSGSPIIQNGKLVGAVTHVLINNPEKGYGISIESMMDEAYESATDAAA